MLAATCGFFSAQASGAETHRLRCHVTVERSQRRDRALELSVLLDPAPGALHRRAGAGREDLLQGSAQVTRIGRAALVGHAEEGRGLKGELAVGPQVEDQGRASAGHGLQDRLWESIGGRDGGAGIGGGVEEGHDLVGEGWEEVGC